MNLAAVKFACHEAIPLSDASQIGEARRRAVRMAVDLDWSEAQRGEVAIVATELATNLSRHAQRGELLLRPLLDSVGGIELISLDRGPGMPDLSRCLEDGYSTGGTAGNGLGAIRRLATEFDIFTHSTGTAVLVRMQPPRKGTKSGGCTWGAVSRTAPYETMCGDIWCVAERPDEFSILVADGLGHGPLAAEAVQEAAVVFERDPFTTVTQMMTSVDARMRGTRGGTVAVARFDARQQTLKYAGVGNIAASLRGRGLGSGRGLVSHNGTVGVQMRKVQEFEYPCETGGLLIMHSDGLQSRWSLDAYPGLVHRHPALIAAILYRDFSRGRDDVTVAAVRFATSQAE